MVHSLQTGRKIGVITAILMSLCIITICSVSARFAVSAMSSDKARVARFSVLTTLNERYLVLNGGDEKTILFTVANGDETVSEVSIEYDVTVSVPSKFDSIEGFGIVLFRNGEPQGDFASERIDDAVVYTFYGVGDFEAGIRTIHNLELVLSISEPTISETFELSVDVIARQRL